MRSIVALCALLVVAATLVSATNQKGLDFLAANKVKPGVVTLPSGLQYKVLKSGSGQHHPTADSSCDCHYAGTLIDGTEFDSSYKRGQPTAFAPNQVIKGWTEAMQLMVEGDKWEMYIPSELAYGESGSPPKIGGGDALIFQMELIKIKGKSVPAVRCDPKTLAGCSEQESTFIGKVGAWSPAQLQTESDRLGKMNVAHMKPELAAWISRRRTILGKLLAADSKQEL